MALILVSLTILILLLSCTYKDTRALGELKPRKTMISVLAGQSSSEAGIEEMINDLLKAEMKDVELEWEPMGWGEKFEAQMQARFASGEVPDIMIGKAQDVATYVSSGNLAPISETLTNFVQEDALTGLSFDGKVYGIPYNAFYQGVFYNKDIFLKYGLKPPETRADLVEIISLLKQNNIVPFASHFLENWYMGNIIMQFMIGDIFMHTRDWGDQFRAGKVSYATSRDVYLCCMAAKEIFTDSWEDAIGIDQVECDQRFAGGQAAMYVTGSWTLQNINAENPPIRVGIFPYPNRTGNARLIFEPNLTFMKSSKTENVETVDRVLRTLFENRDLSSRISDYTKASSLLKENGAGDPLLIQDDIDLYAKKFGVFDATVGNTQLIWSFQEEVANHLDDWIQGKASLATVLEFADKNRTLSAP